MTKKLLTLTLVGLSTIANADGTALSTSVWNGTVRGFVNTSTGRVISGPGAGAYLDDAIRTYRNGMPKVHEATMSNRLSGLAAVLNVSRKQAQYELKQAVRNPFVQIAGLWGVTAIGTGGALKTAANYQAAQEAQRIAEDAQKSTSVKKSFIKQAQDKTAQLVQLAITNPQLTAAVAAGSMGLTAGIIALVKALRTEKEVTAVTPLSLTEINEQAKNMQHLISLLRKHGYTQVDVKASDLVTPVVNKTSADFVVSCLNS